LDRLGALDSQVAGLRQRVAAASREPDEDEASEDDAPDDDADRLTSAEIQAVRRELRDARQALDARRAQFLDRIDAERAALTEERARTLVLAIERERLVAELDRHVAARQQALVAAVEALWSKYRISLREIEAERDAARAQLARFVNEMGYGE
jgi:type I restriction enzyme M protein